MQIVIALGGSCPVPYRRPSPGPSHLLWRELVIGVTDALRCCPLPCGWQPMPSSVPRNAPPPPPQGVSGQGQTGHCLISQ